MEWKSNNSNKEYATKINNNKRYQDGDAVDASSMNAMVDGVLVALDKMNLLEKQNKFLTEHYINTALNINLNHLRFNWYQDTSTLNSKKITLNFSTTKFYVKMVVDHNYLSGSAINSINSCVVDIKETQKLRDTHGIANDNFNYYVDIYSDAEFINFMTRLTGTVNYTYKSLEPIGD